MTAALPCSTLGPCAPPRQGLAPWQQARAQALLLEYLDEGISVTRVADACALSRSHFTRKFKLSTGLSPHEWLRHQRVERAKVMLRETGCTLSDIGAACGFFDQAHFCRIFSRLEGVTPQGWRRRLD
ncbi:MAG: HTH-type transcriptional activator RhaR [Pseudomonas citronellolis]|nr:MAG: HTH-type transcriptional activator RhaR [Pseudomonas citronellolis]